MLVGPEERRSGVGKVLLQAAEKLASESGKARMDLTTARTNKAAQAAYESLGWIEMKSSTPIARLSMLNPPYMTCTVKGAPMLSA